MSRSLDLEVPVNWGDGERFIIVTHYSYSGGSPGHSSPRGDCPGCPPEPSCLEDIECHWQDTGADLSEADWTSYGDEIDEACWRNIEDEAGAAESDAVDRAYERMKDRSLETI